MINTLPAGEHAFSACYVRYADDCLVLGNELFERRWVIQHGLLYAQRFFDQVTGQELFRAAGKCPAPTPPFALPESSRTISWQIDELAGNTLEAPSLQVILRVAGAANTLVYTFRLFAALAGVATQLTVEGEVGAIDAVADDSAAYEPTGVEEFNPVFVPSCDVRRDALEQFDIDPTYLRVIKVELRDQTDVHNELVQEHEWLLSPNESNVRLSGNLFFLENNLTKSGLMYIKEAPLPHARPVPTEYDLTLRRGILTLNGHGMDSAVPEGYRYAVVAYSGGHYGRTAAVHSYQKLWRHYDPTRDGKFLSNTWGDRSRDANINAHFMTAEVSAGAALGVDIIQIDDGWEQGRTANSSFAAGPWEGFYAHDDNFWDVNKEGFPEGMKPVTDFARSHGMEFGLWFGPDSAHDFANWEKDAVVILGLYRDYGVRYIKIDGVKARTRTGERNLQRFFARVLAESDGAVVFDMDVTAEVRPGYFGMINVGPLFIENRYTDYNSYWPHQTLRNLWKLTRYIDPLRLRMEFLNNTRHPEQYPGGPLDPIKYTPDYLFASLMFGNQLGWYEIQHLPAEYVAAVAPLVQTWKAHREAVYAGQIHPIGAAPDGLSWTGFASISGDTTYLLLLREFNGNATHKYDLPLLTGNYQVEYLAGTGTATVADGVITATIPEAQRYLLVKLQG